MPASTKPHILFMGRIFEDAWGGVREMAESLLRAAAPICEAEGRTIEVLVPRAAMCPVEAPAIREVVLPRHGGNRILWDHGTVPGYANGARDAVLYNIKLVLPERLRIPGFSTIHDLMYFPQPGKYRWREYFLGDSLYMRLAVSRTVRRAPLVHTVSEYTAEDARDLFPRADPAMFRTIHHGVDHARFAPGPWSDEDRQTWAYYEAKGVRGPFVFYSGSFSRRKNVGVLAAAFERFHRAHPEYRLVLTGGNAPVVEDPRLRRALRRIPRGAVVRLGEVSARGLGLLYQRAAFYVFPSLYEGFGMPPLEAQAAGCPVICSNATSLPEVVGESALTFDPRSGRALHDCMERLHHEGERERFRTLGTANAARFTWDAAARSWLALADETYEMGARR